ncbi:hypothetical protein [Sciscionella marina]|uniref:hypothetical protein n=1 Tax=Sciscionella marina TaxID=508770 RepID=UPI000379CD77|nr:hypothetical protein [Sciscionella marina]
MKKVTENPPQYKAIQWDGAKESEFTDNLPDVTAVKSGDDLVVLQDSFAVTVEKGSWLIVPDSGASLTASCVVTADEFKGNYSEAG